MSEKKIVVSEHFLTIQGEGETMGHPALFVRLTGCNLQCGNYAESKWKCDTYDIMRSAKFSMYVADYAHVLFAAFQDFFLKTATRSHDELPGGFGSIVFTGGEPLLQQAAIAELLFQLQKLVGKERAFHRIEFETNGTSYFEDKLVDTLLTVADDVVINCSPKLKSSGIPIYLRRSVTALTRLHHCATEILPSAFLSYKFVVANEADIEEVIQEFILKVTGCNRMNVILMPAAETREQLAEKTQELWSAFISAGLRIGTRLQIVAFDKKAGV